MTSSGLMYSTRPLTAFPPLGKFDDSVSEPESALKKLTVSILLHLYRFNATMIPKEDLSMEVRSRRYGTRTMFDTAANHQP